MTRTTLALDADVLELVRNLAAARGVSMGEAANLLIRKGIDAREETRTRNGFVLFNGPKGGARFALADIEAANEQADSDYIGSFH